MSRTSSFVSAGLILSSLAACGGSVGGDAETHTASLRLGAAGPSAPLTPSPHAELVQSLYLAYFGRAPDTAGFVFWNGIFDQLHLPVNATELFSAYAKDTDAKRILDGFVSGAEAQHLYAGSNAEFVNTIYTNLFGRDAEALGRQYWAAKLDNNLITRPMLALAILAGAQADDQLAISKRNDVSSRYMAALAAAGVKNDPSLSAIGRDLLALVNKDTDLPDFQAQIDIAVQTQKQATAPTHTLFYTGFKDVYSDIGKAVRYEYSFGSGIVSALSGKLVFGQTERMIDFGRPIEPGSQVSYHAPIVASTRVAANADESAPTLLMLCQEATDGSRPFKSTDVLVIDSSQVLLSAADLTGQTLTMQREDCAQQSAASIIFDNAGNATVATSDGTNVYPAASVNEALHGALYSSQQQTVISWRAYRYAKADGTFRYAIVSNVTLTPVRLRSLDIPPVAGALSLWSQE